MRSDGGAWIDRLARSLADGRISRREAVKRSGAMLAGGAVLGVGPALDSVANAESLLRGRKHCPHGHASCGTKCCPTNEICVTHKHKHKKPKHKCTCAHPHTNCSGHCTTLASDPSNCGKCGHHCPSGTVCSHGTCITTCHTGLTACGASCVNLATDPHNCGTCGKACAAGDTCVNSVCTGPATPTCTDGIQNGQETDVDCGGPVCPKCANGKKCALDSDCVNGVCHQGICQAPTCSDGIQNEGETDIDCGGPNCGACADGKDCNQGTDCVSRVCTGGVCQTATCNDAVKNGNETDVDCGGGTCPKCPDGKHCLGATDCIDGVCSGGICAQATCSDAVQNGNETDVDCGGGTCPKCPDGKHCLGATDCIDGVCSGGICAQATCFDGVQNEGETDIDCGGPHCPACPIGEHCMGASDCVTAASGSCQEVVCQATVCTSVADNTNLPANQDACHTGTCTSGVPGQTPAGAGTACGTNMQCDGIGNCKSINGQTCTGDASCVNGHCAQGYCCDSACTTPCMSCAVGGHLGTCSNVALGTACSTGVCNSNGQCVQCNSASDCPPPQNVSSTMCQSNTCQIMNCDPGFADCNFNYSDGCEVNTSTSNQNCGMCGHQCSGMTPNCTAGVCT